MEFTSVLTLEMAGKPFLLEKRIALLHAIHEHGSISKAAKNIPMSYKSAWEAVDMMNNLSPKSIVQRETGGKNGGGTTVTEYGLNLLRSYKILKEEHAHFLERLAEVADMQSGEFKTIEKLALQISARNQLQGKVVSIDAQEVNTKVGLRLKSGQLLYAVITKEAVENLYIQKQQSVIVIFKSSSVIVYDTKQEKKENVLRGKVKHVQKDKVDVKMSVDIGEEEKIVSVMSIQEYENFSFNVGEEVMVYVECNDVMLGR